MVQFNGSMKVVGGMSLMQRRQAAASKVSGTTVVPHRVKLGLGSLPNPTMIKLRRKYRS